MPNQLTIENQGGVSQRLNAIIECMPDNVYWMDINSTFLGCNDNVLRFMGLTREQYVGKSYDDLVKMGIWPEDQAKSFKKDDDEVIKSGMPKIDIEDPPLPGPHGKLTYYRASRVPIKNDAGEVIGIVGISRDVTEEKLALERERNALEKAAVANTKAQLHEEIQKAILTFTATMSHDLRTPLSTISLVDSLLLKTLPALTQVYTEFKSSHPDLDQDDSRYIHPKHLKLVLDSYKSIAEALKQAETYIDTTLKIVRGVATGSELLKKEDLVSCSVEEILRRAVSNYPYKDEVDQAKVHLDTMDSFEFMGNSIFMARIIQNLIKNAFEQIHLKGKGEIFIKCDEGEPLNYLYLKDTAGGVTKEVIERLFDGFNSTKKGGTGIGLSSAKQIMQAFGGDINCHLVAGDCIEFVLSFPKPNSDLKQ